MNLFPTGSRPGHKLRAIASLMVGIGVAIGLGGAAGFTRLMQSLLFGISPLDPITFTAMPVVLAAAAVPAICRRAARRRLIRWRP